MLENTNTILGIIVSILGAIGYISGIIVSINKVFEKGSFSNINAIEYGLSDSDKQNSMRYSAIIKVIFFFALASGILMILSLLLVYESDKYFAEFTVKTDVFRIFLSGLWIYYSFFHLWMKDIIKIFLSPIFYITLFISFYCLLVYQFGETRAVIILIIIIIILTIVKVILIKKNSEKTDNKVSLADKTEDLYLSVCFIYCAISLLGGTCFKLVKVCLNDKDKSFGFFISLDKNDVHADILSQSAVSFIQEYIFTGWVIVCSIIFMVIIIGILRNYYNKMANLAFLCGEKKDKTSEGENRIYIYKRIGNQFLYEDRDNLQYNKKEFDDELRKVKKEIKKKKWDKGVRSKLEKAIDKLQPYSGYIKIDRGKYRTWFKDINDCMDILELYSKREKCNISNIMTNAMNEIVDEMTEEFQEMTAVKLLPEDELKNYTIYPIIDEERSGFFN